MKQRLAIVEGIRTPFCKAGSVMSGLQADDLGAMVVKELIAKTEIPPHLIDELIMGNVGQPSNACNIARVIALKAGLPEDLSAYTVHRNCASGLQSISSGYEKLLAGQGEVLIVGGTESMSNYPFKFSKKMTYLLSELIKARTVTDKLRLLCSFRPQDLKPVIAIVEGLTDPTCGLNMGQTAEILASEFSISREQQDAFALQSHLNADRAQQKGILSEEILSIFLAPHYPKVQHHDNSIREDQSLEKLAKLKPFFNKLNGTITVANACPISDGAGALLIMLEDKARELGYQPLGYLSDYSYAGLAPDHMGLGPVYATAKLLKKSGLKMQDFDLIELNEAFAAQVLANESAFSSTLFAQKFLGQDKALGSIDKTLLNVNGGAIALGHPVGATGTRLVLTLLKELRRRNKNRGLATLCIGGGQGAAFVLEVQ
ncbi:acetyl-CoA acetyltransferase [Psychromonas sp. CNPT3]|uniref:thiolase family protein n=1 Tax=Psychromonas sp. CNPT3 TaxID=314282 RepID=UPI00006E9169|nr:thiolase family protein [Psychromonas sp. CNPT3]AGH81311.1 acetyl-CoA acetyltransferase [Psychromonas sp. CNPT3]